MGLDEAACGLSKYHHVKIYPPAASYMTQLENKHNVIIQHPSIPSSLIDSPLLKYFKRPSHYQMMLFLEYIEHSCLLKSFWLV